MMNKRLFFVVLTILVSFSSFARSVSRERALKVAENFVSRYAGAHTSLSFECQKITGSDHKPAYFVFNTGNHGFVIVSGDDSVSPILGYSTESNFDSSSVPSNVSWWLGMISDGISKLRQSNFTASAEVASAWLNIENWEGTKAEDNTGEVVLNTALWNQGDPFNMFCPTVNGQKAMTGCVATATAIVMQYNRWPERGTGDLPSYSYTGDDGKVYTIEGKTLGEEYDWDKMPLGTPVTGDEKTSVARLMSDIGIMCQMSYSPLGSGASTYFAARGLIEYMDYDPGMTEYYQPTFDRCLSVVREEIINDRPILVSGRNSGSGHAFVIDGYDADGLMHINWGWGGFENGFFLYPNFNSYSLNIYLYAGIKKADHSSSGITDHLYYYIEDYHYENNYCTISYAVSNNHLALDYNGEFALGLTDRYGNLVKLLSTPRSRKFQGGNAFYFNDRIAVPKNESLGDGVVVFHRPSGSDKWIPAIFDSSLYESVPLDVSALEKITTLSWDRETKRLKIISDPEAEFELIHGNMMTKCSSVIDFRSKPAGIYTLKIRVGADEISININI